MRNLTSLAHVGPLLEDVPWEVLVPPDTSTPSADRSFSQLSQISGLSGGRYINTADPWQISLLVISSINVALISLYWLYIVYMSYMKTTHWRPPLLPHTLILGLLLSATAGFPHLTPEIGPACQGARMTTSISYTVVYSSLLVRLVCLRSLHRGIFLPTPYQALLLLFCVLVQVAMSVQWYAEDRAECWILPPLSNLLSIIYPFLLFLFVLVLSTITRKAREHYSEARSIWVTLLAHIPLWIAWTAAAIVLDEHFHIICGFGLQGLVLLTLVFHLLPRVRFLTYQSRDGYDKFENDPYSYQSDAGFLYGTSSKSSWEPSFSAFKSKPERESSPYLGFLRPMREKESSSYLGFHRPTRVVPPSSSSHSTFAPGLIYPDRYAYVLPPLPHKPRLPPTFTHLPAFSYSSGRAHLTPPAAHFAPPVTHFPPSAAHTSHRVAAYRDRRPTQGRYTFRDRAFKDNSFDYIF